MVNRKSIRCGDGTGYRPSKTVEITSRDSFSTTGNYHQHRGAIKVCLERHPELSADIMDRAIVLAGGGTVAQPDQLVSQQTGIPVLSEEHYAVLWEQVGPENIELLKRVMAARSAR